MNSLKLKNTLNVTLNFISNRIFFIIILIISTGVASLIGIPSNFPRIVHAILFGLTVGIICLILFIITFLVVYIFSLLKDFTNFEKLLLYKKQIMYCVISLILLYCIAILPLGLHPVSQKDHYIYVNYLGIPKITKVFDFIGFQNDSVGDYNYKSELYQAYPFNNGKASVWLFYTNFSEYETLYRPACINTSGEMLFYGYCDIKQESNDSYAKEIFEAHNFIYDRNIPLWKQYDDFYKFINNE